MYPYMGPYVNPCVPTLTRTPRSQGPQTVGDDLDELELSLLCGINDILHMTSYMDPYMGHYMNPYMGQYIYPYVGPYVNP